MMWIRTLSTAATVTAATALLSWCGPACAQAAEDGFSGPSAGTRLRAAERTAGDILAQPIRDAGFLTPDIPDPLVRAAQDPYALSDTASCTEVLSEIKDLNAYLESDSPDAMPRISRAERLVEAGGRAAVNSLIPLRVVVRELSGAAPAQRRLQAAVDFGYARRGFLRGVSRLRRCEAGSANPDDRRDPQVAAR